ALFIPAGLHRHRVFAHWNGQAQLRTKLHAYRTHGVVQPRIFAGVAGSGHPVGGKLDVGEFFDTCGSEVGQRLANRHTARGRGIQQSQRSALAHGHGFAGIDVKTGGSHRTIGHRHLPGTDHLVARHHTGDAAVTDGDQEALAGDSRMAQHTADSFIQVDRRGTEIIAKLGFAGGTAVHTRSFAGQYVERHVHRLVTEVTVGNGQVQFFGSLADYREGAALALTDGLEALEIGGIHGEYVALLGFVTPDLMRRHAGFVVGNVAQLETTATTGIVDQLRECVGQAARANVVNELDRVLLAQLPAAV